MKKFFILFVLLLIPLLASAEAVQIDFLLSGMRDPLTDEPLAGGKVYTYDGGTSTPVNLYTDREATVDATNPIILDAYGRAIVFGDDIYRFIVKNASDVIIWSSDGLEYKAQTSSTGQAALTENLDANNFKIINMDNGTDNSDAINLAQLTSVQNNLISDIQDIQDNLDVKTFKSLVDTPDSYAGKANQLVRVGSSAVSLDFVSLDDILPEVATQAYPIGAASGDLSGVYPNPSVVKIQGVPISATPPSTAGQLLSYNGSEWTPTAAGAGGITRYNAFTGNSSSVTLTKGVDYQDTPLYFAVIMNCGGSVSIMFDAELTSSVGYYRIINRGGESADRNYDFILYVSSTATSYTLSGQSIQRVSVYCQ